ncbi:30S ribosomal protein S16 [Candidatus Roizmanbacteria bacterium]|nr:30S ribosomal protein S16 [Candidatus Roizmanbacteria bacterium]
MAVALRLMRTGKKSFPNYRIIAVDKRKKRNGAYLEKIGFYNPLTDPATLDIDKIKLEAWLRKGAVVSDGLAKLLKLSRQKS